MGWPVSSDQVLMDRVISMAVGHARLVGGDRGSFSRSGGQRWNWAGWGRWPRNTEKDIIETLIPTFLCLVFNLLRAAFSQIPWKLTNLTV